MYLKTGIDFRDAAPLCPGTKINLLTQKPVHFSGSRFPAK